MATLEENLAAAAAAGLTRPPRPRWNQQQWELLSPLPPQPSPKMHEITLIEQHRNATNLFNFLPDNAKDLAQLNMNALGDKPAPRIVPGPNYLFTWFGMSPKVRILPVANRILTLTGDRDALNLPAVLVVVLPKDMVTFFECSNVPSKIEIDAKT